MNISALDENGTPVDWWFIYKVPQHARNALSPGAPTGYEYVYYDQKIGKPIRSPNLLNGGKGALNQTLSAVFKSPDATTGWILYNDERPAAFVPPGDDGTLGHTKGVMAFDTGTGSAFWLLHSWPKYVDPKAAQSPAAQFGQTYICINLDIGAARQLATQMANHQEPQVYDGRVGSLGQTDPLYLLSQKLNPNAVGDSNVLDLSSRGGLRFKVIAKNRNWGKDFWNELVGVVLQEDVDVETWIRVTPTDTVPANLDIDKVHKVFDIKYIDLNPIAPWAWPETLDHAKWGITYQNNWVCVGDINRMISQRKRGGGTVALQDPVLWQALKNTDHLVLPPGVDRATAVAKIQETHLGSKSFARAITAKRAAKA
jgi:deoxyribonuclease-2